jgi:hypothetical protein
MDGPDAIITFVSIDFLQVSDGTVGHFSSIVQKLLMILGLTLTFCFCCHSTNLHRPSHRHLAYSCNDWFDIGVNARKDETGKGNPHRKPLQFAHFASAKETSTRPI